MEHVPEIRDWVLLITNLGTYLLFKIFVSFSKLVCPYTLSFEKSSNPTNVYEELLAFNMYFKRPQIPGF